MDEKLASDISAFVDGKCTNEEQERLLELLCEDKRLDEEWGKLHQLKSMLKENYNVRIEDLDAALVKRMKEGDSRAYNLFIKIHNRSMEIKIRKMLRKARVPDDRHHVNDVFQSTFIKLWLGLANFKGKSKFSTWLYTLTERQTINYINKYKRTQGKLVKSINSTGIESAFDAGDQEGRGDFENTKNSLLTSNHPEIMKLIGHFHSDKTKICLLIVR